VLYQQPSNGIAIGQRIQYQPIQPSDPLVFGFWKVPTNVCADVCYNAIKCGYRRLDCACDYENEVQVDMGIAKAIQYKLCTREELFIASKLWNTYHKREHVPMALHRTLQDLQLTYLDEYLIHFPIYPWNMYQLIKSIHPNGPI
jgi:diketogulonate reductase-like aldo/keto reductase